MKTITKTRFFPWTTLLVGLVGFALRCWLYSDLEDGLLPDELCYDGVHLNKAGCRQWLDYLRTHAVGEVPVPAEEEPAVEPGPDVVLPSAAEETP